MAKSKNPLLIQGTINDLTYYTYKGNPCVRRKSSLTRDKFMKDMAFAGARASGSIFGRASTASKQFRLAISPFDKAFSDGSLHNRLTQQIAAQLHHHPDYYADGVFNWHALVPSLQTFSFDKVHKFENIVNLECCPTVSNTGERIHFQFSNQYGPIFNHASNNSHFRMHLVLVPIGDATNARSFDHNTDLSKEATWTSEWLDAKKRLDHDHILEIPAFMRRGKPIAILLAIEPGFQEGSNVYTSFSNRAMKLLMMV